MIFSRWRFSSIAAIVTSTLWSTSYCVSSSGCRLCFTLFGIASSELKNAPAAHRLPTSATQSAHLNYAEDVLPIDTTWLPYSSNPSLIFLITFFRCLIFLHVFSFPFLIYAIKCEVFSYVVMVSLKKKKKLSFLFQRMFHK